MEGEGGVSVEGPKKQQRAGFVEKNVQAWELENKRVGGAAGPSKGRRDAPVLANRRSSQSEGDEHALRQKLSPHRRGEGGDEGLGGGVDCDVRAWPSSGQAAYDEDSGARVSLDHSGSQEPRQAHRGSHVEVDESPK